MSTAIMPLVTKPFEIGMRTQVAFGSGSIAQVGQRGSDLGGTRGFLVTDPGILRAGHVARAEQSLREAGLQTYVFTDVRENPTTDDVDRGLQAARDFAPDLLVAIGGGSAMDCAKGINFLLTNGGRMQDYWGVGKATRAMLPSIAIPTTAGTGSEAQSFALISDPQTHQKMACGDKKAAFKFAILDPELTRSQPPRVTALTGIDAVAHALETLVTRTQNPFSRMCSQEAWRLLIANFPQVIVNGDDLEVRTAMQLGSHWAGVAIEHSMLGAAHSLANPLTAHYGIVHGQAVSVMLPFVVRYNSVVCLPTYGEAIRVGQIAGVIPLGEGIEPLFQTLQRLSYEAGLATRLRDLGVPREALQELAEDAARQWTARFNPRELQVADFEALYVDAY